MINQVHSCGIGEYDSVDSKMSTTYLSCRLVLSCVCFLFLEWYQKSKSSLADQLGDALLGLRAHHPGHPALAKAAASTTYTSFSRQNLQLLQSSPSACLLASHILTTYLQQWYPPQPIPFPATPTPKDLTSQAPRPPYKTFPPHPPINNPDRTLHNHKAPLKRQKLICKHTNLLSRIAKTAPKQPQSTKRRRPGRKLVASLESLADALPGGAEDEGAWEGIADGNESSNIKNNGMKIKHKSLKSRPGAGRKKEKLVAMERERFARNLAEMAASRSASADGGMIVGGEGGKEGGSKERWAAIRGFIEQTMERRPGGEGGVGKT